MKYLRATPGLPQATGLCRALGGHRAQTGRLPGTYWALNGLLAGTGHGPGTEGGPGTTGRPGAVGESGVMGEPGKNLYRPGYLYIKLTVTGILKNPSRP